jgi:hypothetical protein
MAYTSEPAEDKPALPEYLGRKGKGPMDEEEFVQVVSHSITQSVLFVDSELSIERARATEFYLGKPFGNEEEGRSQVILTELRDAVDGMMPSLMRVFFGPEHAVEFLPNRADGVEEALQKTDYVRYVFEEDNPGFQAMMDVIKDGLIRKIGIFKWGWDDSAEVQAYKQEGITQQELEMLAEDDDVELRKLVKIQPTKQMQADFKKAMEQYQQQMQQYQQQMQQMKMQAAQQPQQPGQPPQAPPQGPPPPEKPVMPQYYDVELTRTIKGGRARVWSIPPEEFIYNRQARSPDVALLLGHRTDRTRGELIAMGVPEKDIDEHAGPGGGTDVTLKGNAEEIARRDVAGVGRVVGFGYTTDPEMGHANDKILYGEFYMRIDYDGDGIAELRKVCTIGPVYHPVKNDPCSSAPFAIFSPYPEPHTLLGGSVGDRTMDIQKINSSLLRAMLDSLAGSIFPRTVYQEGQASVADIMNTAIGAPIRERITGVVRTLEMPFTGKEALPILQFMQEVIERRVGQSKGAAGLDDDALQSTGKEAVGAHLQASQAQIELVARVFAENTLKPMFKGLGRLLVEHQPRVRVVRLRGHFVDVNPRSWDDTMDVTCNVGLGSTYIEKKISTLMAVAVDQQQIIEKMGLDNPIVSLPMWRNTRAQILRLQGIKDVDNFYKNLPMDWTPPPAPPPPPSPEEIMAKAEMEMSKQKNMKDLAIKQDELKLKQEHEEWHQGFEERKLAQDAVLRREAMNAQFHSDVTEAQQAHDLETETREVELAVQTHDMLHDQEMERAAHAHEVNMGNRAADTADAAQQADAAAAQQKASQGGAE